MIKLYTGDCLSVLKKLPKNSAKLVLGSPPYSMKGERYGYESPVSPKHGKAWGVQDWIDWMISITIESIRVAPVAAFVVNDTYKDGQWFPAVDGLIWSAHRLGIICERSLIWHKNAPPNRRDWFGNDWERVIVFKRDRGPVPTWNPEAVGTAPKYTTGGAFRQRDSKGQRRKGGDYPTNPITKPRDVIRAVVGGGLMGHPLAHENEAPYPESLIMPIVLALTNPKDIILDPFAGSGTTLAVAKKTGRSSIGIELRKSQVAIIKQRLASI